MSFLFQFIMKNHFFRNCFVATFPTDWKVFTWQQQNELIMPYWQAMEDNYEAQIRRVKEVVPEDRLLIWNIKEGWEPLCRFLGKPVPNIPIPVKF